MVMLWLLLGGGCTALPTTGAAKPETQTKTARGVLLDVVSSGIQQVDRFSLRTEDGEVLSFVPGPAFNASVSHAMTPGHMRQHMALADPVSVTYRQENGVLIALSAVDANN